MIQTMTQFEADCLHWHGKLLTGKRAHWCHDWDGLPIDETCEEWDACTCELDPEYFDTVPSEDALKAQKKE